MLVSLDSSIVVFPETIPFPTTSIRCRSFVYFYFCTSDAEEKNQEFHAGFVVLWCVFPSVNLPAFDIVVSASVEVHSDFLR